MSALFNPFYGRINRGDWWLLQLVIFVFAGVGMFMTITFASDPNLPTDERTSSESFMLLLVILSVVYMNFASCLNRLRDSNTSRLMYLAFQVPMIGTGLMIYYCGILAGDESAYSASATESAPKYNTHHSY